MPQPPHHPGSDRRPRGRRPLVHHPSRGPPPVQILLCWFPGTVLNPLSQLHHGRGSPHDRYDGHPRPSPAGATRLHHDRVWNARFRNARVWNGGFRNQQPRTPRQHRSARPCNSFRAPASLRHRFHRDLRERRSHLPGPARASPPAACPSDPWACSDHRHVQATAHVQTPEHAQTPGHVQATGHAARLDHVLEAAGAIVMALMFATLAV